MTAADWNARVPVGTPVRYTPIIGGAEYRDTRTRSEAWALKSGHGLVLIEGTAGGVALEALQVLAPGGAA